MFRTVSNGESIHQYIPSHLKRMLYNNPTYRHASQNGLDPFGFLTNGLLLYLPLWALQDSAFNSIDAYRHVSTVTGAIWGPDGRTLDGDDKVSVPDHADFNIGANITVIIRYTGASQAAKTAISHFDYGSDDRAWKLGSGNVDNGKLRVYLSDDGTNNAGHRKDYESSIEAFDGTSHTGGFTFDGTTLALFVDGVLDGTPTKTLDDAIATIHNCPAALSLGCELNSGALAAGVTATLHEAWFYNRTFATVEMLRHHSITRWRV